MIPQNRVIKAEYRGAPQTVELLKRAILASQDKIVVRQTAEMFCQGLDSKDYLSEYLALYRAGLSTCRYMRDPKTREFVKAPWIICDQIANGIRPCIDCLPGETLLLKRDFSFCKMADLKAGDEIWGYDRWSKVQATVYKGVRHVDAIRLNNGSTFFATADHKVYVERCGHSSRDCGCKAKDRTRVRIRVSELADGDVLTQPDRIDFGTDEMDPGRAYIEGLYLSDGWHQKSAFAISGKDGHPKEAQKKDVEDICARLGVSTKMYDRFIMVKDSAWTHRLQLMGGHAPEKKALSIDLGESAAANLMRGIMADSGANSCGVGRTFTSMSYMLTMQTRVLHKMFGVNCSERFISNHGGLGKHPIWRLGVREKTGERKDGKGSKALRVKSIERDIAEVPVYDLQTDDHYVYLPQADVTVSNCDDYTGLLGAWCLAIGASVRIVTVAFNDAVYLGKKQYSHVYVQAQIPQTGIWLSLDPVAAEKTAEMQGRVVNAAVWTVA